MEDSSYHGLPPSKRFKLLQLQENSQPIDPLIPKCLPAKKRVVDSFLHHHEPSFSPCLPAKKRVWAPLPISPIKPPQEDSPPISIKPSSDLPSHSADQQNPPEEDANKDFGHDQTKREQEAEEEEEDDGVVCAVCRSTDADPDDPIVFCDSCDLMAHASCYGNPLIQSIPEGDWFCLKCESKEEPSCCLCPMEGGALKPTTDGRWAHIMCALLVPEVYFRDPKGRDGIDCSRVPVRRREMNCYLCRSNSGCAVECSEPKCGVSFHVSCGLNEGLCIEYREGRGGAIVAGFCLDHTQLWKKQQLTGKFKIVAREHVPKEKIRA